MSRLSRFNGRELICEIDGDSFKVYPLKAKDQDLLYDVGDESKKSEAIKALIKLSLKDEKDITDDDVDNMTLGIKTKFVTKIMEANGLGDDMDELTKKYSIDKSRQNNNDKAETKEEKPSS